MNRPSGDQSAVAPPVPISNTEVKRCSANGSASIGCARVGHRQSYAPGFGNKTWGFFCFDFLCDQSGGRMAAGFRYFNGSLTLTPAGGWKSKKAGAG